MTVLAGDDPAAIATAADVLAAGGLVGLPTETVYGLAARADDDRAAAGIFAAKGRPPGHPLIVHVADAATAARFAASLPPAAQALMQAFWPGPLTVIVPRQPGLATTAAGGHATVGLRCPSHPVAQALLQACAARGVPGLAAPSANRFGRVSPTTAAHVAAEFGEALLVLDGGACPVGIESAIVDCSGPQPVLLRPGVLGRDRITAVLGGPLAAAGTPGAQAPGTLAAHYAPRARVRLLDGQALATALQTLDRLPQGLAVYSPRQPWVPGAGTRWHWWAMPADADAAARSLFATLRAIDDSGAPTIWVEAPPDTPDWEGVSDRLRRAAAAG